MLPNTNKMKHLLLLLFISQIGLFTSRAQDSKPVSDSAKITVFVGTMQKVARKKDIIYFIGQKSKKEYRGISNSVGKFDIKLPGGETYDIKIGMIGDEEDYSSVEIEHLDQAASYEIQILYEPAKVFELKNVEFNTGQHTLRKDSYRPLNDLVEILKIKDHMKIEIGGHTDNVGSDENNLSLSQRRAETVRKYLISKGIASSRLTAKGYGERAPRASNDTAEGRQSNRRTEVTILSE